MATPAPRIQRTLSIPPDIFQFEIPGIPCDEWKSITDWLDQPFPGYHVL